MNKNKVIFFSFIAKIVISILVCANFNFVGFSQEKPLENYQDFKSDDSFQIVQKTYENRTSRLENIGKNLDEFDLNQKNKSIEVYKSDDLSREGKSKKTIDKLKVDLANKENKIKELENLLEKARDKNINFESSQSMEQGTSDLYKSLGTAYVQAKRYEDAIKAYGEALKLDPDDADVYYYLGLLHQHANNDVVKSIKYFDDYLRLSPQGQYSEKAQIVIKILKQD